MLTPSLPRAGNPQSFRSVADFAAALRDAGTRVDGPPILAVWAGKPERSRLEGRRHSHVRGQLICIEDGLAQVRTDKGSWLVPPNRAVWIPPNEEHQVTTTGVTQSWNLFLAPRVSGALPEQPCVFGVNTLLSALVARATAWTHQAQLDASQRRLAMVLIDEIRRAPRDLLHLPMPSDRRLVRIATAIADDPSDPRTREEWAAWAGLSERTLSRQFQAQVSMSFAQWRKQALLIHALERLLRGESVSSVADALGYATPSNFISMFRKALGDTPAHYAARSPRGAD